MTKDTPHPLPAVCGHQDRIEGLLSTFRSNRLAPALLFAGPEGIGKHWAALHLTAAFSCPNQPGLGGDCCTVCRKIVEGQHPDLLELRREKEKRVLTIQSVRNCLSTMQEQPWELSHRTAILDEAERLSPAAAHCLLKALEEPLASSRFILITSSPQRLPETIRSRCSEIRFLPLPEEDLARHLAKFHDIEPTVARQASQRSLGRYGRALAACQSEVRQHQETFCRRILQEDPTPETAAVILDELRSESGEDRRRELESLLEYLLDLFRPALRGAIGIADHQKNPAPLQSVSLRDVSRAASRIVLATRTVATGAALPLTIEALLLDLHRILPNSQEGRP